MPKLLNWILVGLLFGISFVHEYLWFLLIPGFILFLFLLKKETPWKNVFLSGWCVGTLLHMGALFWYWSSYPIELLWGVSPVIQLVTIFICWTTSSLALGLGIGAFALCAKKLVERPLLLCLGVPPLWVLGEILGAFLFSVYFSGPGSYLNADFSFGHIGYLISQHPLLLQLSSVYGLYGLSYVYTLFLSLLYVYVDKKFYKKLVPNAVVLLVLTGLVASLFIYSPVVTNSNTKVIAIETYFDKEFVMQVDQKKIKKNETLSSVAAALQVDADTIVLPEDSRFTDAFESSDDVFSWIASQNPLFDGVIVDSGQVYIGTNESVLRAYLYDVKTKSRFEFDKKYLVPHGEFMPYFHGKIISLIMEKGAFTEMIQNLPYRKGVIADSNSIPNSLPAVLFCFESVAPLGVKQALSARHPSLVVHLISHSWFTNPKSLWPQLDGMLRIQSVWNNVPIVTANNMSESKLYLPNGEIRTGEKVRENALWSLKVFEF